MQKCIFDLDDRLSELISDPSIEIITHFFFGPYDLEYKVFEYVDKTFLRFLFKGSIRQKLDFLVSKIKQLGKKSRKDPLSARQLPIDHFTFSPNF